jgi:hypothetical protein
MRSSVCSSVTRPLRQIDSPRPDPIQTVPSRATEAQRGRRCAALPDDSTGCEAGGRVEAPGGGAVVNDAAAFDSYKRFSEGSACDLIGDGEAANLFEAEAVAGGAASKNPGGAGVDPDGPVGGDGGGARASRRDPVGDFEDAPGAVAKPSQEAVEERSDCPMAPSPRPSPAIPAASGASTLSTIATKCLPAAAPASAARAPAPGRRSPVSRPTAIRSSTRTSMAMFTSAADATCCSAAHRFPRTPPHQHRFRHRASRGRTLAPHHFPKRTPDRSGSRPAGRPRRRDLDRTRRRSWRAHSSPEGVVVRLWMAESL